MANIAKLKRRIKTAKNIAQTTRAMELVAASRMKKAQQAALDGKPYSVKLLSVIRNLLGRVIIEEGSQIENYFREPMETKETKTLIVLITPDKGLAGALNSNIARKLLQFINKDQRKIEQYDFIVYGKKGRDIVLRLNGNIIAQFDVGMTQPKFDMVPPVVRLFEEGFLQKKYFRVLLIYTNFINTLSLQPEIVQLLPFKYYQEGNITPEETEKLKQDYLFEPKPETVLSTLLPHYFKTEVYHFLLEAYASEQSARMAAMKNATDNANDIISELTLFYNKARQQVITSEISDITTASLTNFDK